MGSGRYRSEDDDLLDRFKRLEARISALERTPQLGNSASATGGATIFKGGQVHFQDINGVTKVYFGPVTQGGLPVGVGWLYYRDNGKLLWTLEGQDPSHQYFAVRDNVGNIVISDDAVAGQGLATPYIPGQFVNWNAPVASANTLTTFGVLQKAIWRKQHPRFYVWIHITVTATTAEFQFRINSGIFANRIILGPITMNNGNWYSWYGPVTIPGDHLSEFEIDLEARVLTGTGNIAVEVMSAVGMQS
jgi:hypothetical protein